MKKINLWKKTKENHFRNRKGWKRTTAVVLSAALLTGMTKWSLPQDVYGVEIERVIGVNCELSSFNTNRTTADEYEEGYLPSGVEVEYVLDDGSICQEFISPSWQCLSGFSYTFSIPGTYSFEGIDMYSGMSIGTIDLVVEQAYLGINEITGPGNYEVSSGDKFYIYIKDSNDDMGKAAFTADSYGGYENTESYPWYWDNAPYSYIISNRELDVINEERNPWEIGNGVFNIHTDQSTTEAFENSNLMMSVMKGSECNLDVRMENVTPCVTIINDTDIEFTSISVSSPSDSLSYTPKLSTDGLTIENVIAPGDNGSKEITCYKSGDNYMARIIPGIQKITDENGVSGISIVYEYNNSNGETVSGSVSVDDGNDTTDGYLVNGDVSIRLSEVLDLAPKFAFDTVSDSITYDGAAIEAGIDFTMVNPNEGTINYYHKIKGTDNFSEGLPVHAGTYVIKAVDSVTDEEITTELVIGPKTVTTQMQESIVLEEQQYYTGQAKTPEIKIYDGTTLLKKDTDYQLSYSNNINVVTDTTGIAPTITIKGMNDYQGTLTYKFTILYENSGHLYLKGTTLTANKLYYIDGELPEFSTDTGYTIYYSLTSDMTNLSTDMPNTASYTEGEERSYYIQLRNAKGERSDTIYVRCMKDSTSPGVIAKLGQSDNYSALTEQPVNKYYDSLTRVYLEVSDNASGISKAYVYRSYDNKQYTKEELEELAGDKWSSIETNTNQQESLEEGKVKQLYFKVVDNAGNCSYVSTDYMIYDNTNPVISGKAGETLESRYITDALEVQITDEVELKSVTINGEEKNITGNPFTVSLSEGEYTIVATDGAGNQANISTKVIAPVYDVQVNDVEILSESYGYAPADAVKLSINRKAGEANSEATISSVTVDNDLFLITKSGVDYYISVREGAAVGNHTGNITLKYNNNGIATAKVSFSVEKRDITTLVQKSGTEVKIKDNKQLTYGQPLSKLTIDDSSVVILDENGKVIEGTIAFADKKVIPSAGTCQAEWVFTPDGTCYHYTGEPLKGTVNVTVNKKTLQIIVQTGQGKVYGERDKVISYTVNTAALVGNDTVSVTGTPGRNQGEEAGYYSYNMGTLALSKTGAYANYSLRLSAKDKYRIEKAAQTISAQTSYTKIYQDKAFSLNAALTKGNGKLSFKSSDTSVALVYSNGKVSVKGMGVAKITVTAAETTNYKSAAKTITITVQPKNVNIDSVKSASKGTLSVKWAERSGVSGYEIKYSTSKTFSSNSVTTTVTGATRHSKTITGLKSGKKYYVKVRAYKTVNGKKLYGDWSSVYGVSVN